MSVDAQIDYIEFPANDLNQTKEFYQSVFGWKFTDYGEDYCSFEDGRLSGGFFQSDLCSQSQSGAVLVVIYADNLEATQQRVLEAGGSLTKETFSFPGGRRFHFRDRCGNELAVWSDR